MISARELLAAHFSEWHRKVVDDVPQLKRGQVWCRSCGFTTRVDSGLALQYGWPKHCGYTMTIDSPEEQKAAETKP